MLTPVVNAHPNGTSKVEITIFPGNRIEFAVDINSDDILNLVLSQEEWEEYWKKAPKYNERIAYYIENHTSLEIDGNSLINPRVIQWFQGAPDSETKMDSAAIKESTYILKFDWPLSETATRLSFSSAMFAEFEVYALCHLKFIFQGDTVKSKILHLDTQADIPLNRDSLTAILKQLKTPVAVPKGDSSTFRNFAIGFGLPAVVLAVLLLLRRKSKRK